MLRIQAETVLLLACAAASIERISSGVRRTRSITALALPAGSGGRPGRLGFFAGFKASKLLYDCRPYRVCCRFDRPQVKNRNVVVFRILPCVSYRCLWMANEIKNLNDAFPDRFPIECLFYGHTFTVRGFRTVQPVDYVSQFCDFVHAVAFTKSPTVQNVPAMLAAIAGVQRRVL